MAWFVDIYNCSLVGYLCAPLIEVHLLFVIFKNLCSVDVVNHGNDNVMVKSSFYPQALE